ncbi:MAG: hypothetical protein V4508_03140 [Pseudomonadota bacterium]
MASQPVDEEKKVLVPGIRNPDLKRYRVMLAGLDAFDEYHTLAPAATQLRFKLRPRTGSPAADMENLALRIAGDTSSIEVAVAADGIFTLPRSETAEDKDADLVLNKKHGGYRWRPDIHSDGVPDGMRRLGDVRLECKVLIAIAKKEMGFATRTMINGLMLTTDWCTNKEIKMPGMSTRPVVSATLVDGERRLALKIENDGKEYLVPVSDKSYSDDALIELQFVDQTTVPLPR